MFVLPPEAFGPTGALVVLGFFMTAMGLVIRALWKDHLRADQEDRDQRDKALAIVEGVIPTLRELAHAQREANEDAKQRQRRSDAR